jgi:hypothetical protein
MRPQGRTIETGALYPSMDDAGVSPRRECGCRRKWLGNRYRPLRASKAASHSPIALRVCSVISVGELHKRGYQRLRVMPFLSPGGEVGCYKIRVEHLSTELSADLADISASIDFSSVLQTLVRSFGAHIRVSGHSWPKMIIGSGDRDPAG